MTDDTSIEQIPTTTPELTTDRLAALRDLIPEAFTEGKVDFDKLRAALGDVIDGRPERYSFTWAGKRDAIRLLQTPSSATLVPAPEESVNWDTTQHLFIEGDNLEVLKLLYKAYFGKVKLIYIDPPCNTGNDFVYPDDFTDPLGHYLAITGQKDAAGNLLTSNPETSGRYHSGWLNMMYPRLLLARQLLREDGAIFVSIDDNEIQNLRLLMNEIFGEENFVACIIWEKKFSPQNDDRYLTEVHDYIVLYAKNIGTWQPTLLERSDEQKAGYRNPDDDPKGPWASGDLTSKTKAKGHSYEIVSPTGKRHLPPTGRQWAPALETFRKMLQEGRIWFGNDGNNFPRAKVYLSEVQQGIVPITLWKHTEVGHNQEAKQEFNALLDRTEFETPKTVRLMKRILNISTTIQEADVVLDFFSGSAAMAHAVLEQNYTNGGNRRLL